MEPTIEFKINKKQIKINLKYSDTNYNIESTKDGWISIGKKIIKSDKFAKILLYILKERNPQESEDTIKQNTNKIIQQIEINILDKLSTKCDKTKCQQGSFCYRNVCYTKKHKFEDRNQNGKVYVIDQLGYNIINYIVKVNKRDPTKKYTDNEIKVQNYVSKYDLAPKIFKVIDTPTKKYFIMENLTDYGFYDFNTYFKNKTVSSEAINELYKSIQKLHSIGVAHRDLHADNIFYNPTTNKYKFIDYGFAKKTKTEKQACLSEKWIRLAYIGQYYAGPWKKHGNYNIVINKFSIPVWLLRSFFDITNETFLENLGKIRTYDKCSTEFNLTVNECDILFFLNRVETYRPDSLKSLFEVKRCYDHIASEYNIQTITHSVLKSLNIKNKDKNKKCIEVLLNKSERTLKKLNEKSYKLDIRNENVDILDLLLYQNTTENIFS